MKYFSMFSGIGGFEYGIEQAYTESARICEKSEQEECGQRGFRTVDKPRTLLCSGKDAPLCVGYSEIDKYAIQVYQRHFPSHKNFGDATRINPTELPDFDLLCGGFPCQAFSIAGKRRGFEDTRGTMFFEISRILEAKRPKYCLLENVKGLLNHNQGKTFRVIIQTLEELGYDVQWMVLNSKFFGVPQNRERVFIVGSLGRERKPEILPFRENCSRIDEGNGETTNVRTLQGGGHSGGLHSNMTIIAMRSYPRNESREVNPNQERFQNIEPRNDGCSNTLSSVQKDNLICEGYLNTDGWEKRHESIRRVYNPKGISPTIPTGTGGGVMTKIIYKSNIRRLTPLECERLQSFPDGWTEGLSDTQRYKCLGNAVTTNVIREIIKRW